MTTTPEAADLQVKSQGETVKKAPEAPEVIPQETGQATNVKPIQVTAQVSDGLGASQAQTPVIKTVTITIPVNQQQLADWSNGSPSDSVTWFATFWLRMVKKAIRFGWRLVTEKGGSANAGAV